LFWLAGIRGLGFWHWGWNPGLARQGSSRKEKLKLGVKEMFELIIAGTVLIVLFTILSSMKNRKPVDPWQAHKGFVETDCWKNKQSVYRANKRAYR
jgi:hypothetical protein